MFVHYFLIVVCGYFVTLVRGQIVVNTTKGSVNGSNVNNVTVFTGIPFARPPVNLLRYQKPVEPTAWHDTLQCNQGYADMCPQDQTIPDQLGPGNNVSEDCLYLNVFTPNVTANGSLPVIVWVYGGGFTFGAASKYPIDGIVNNLARHGVVVVSFNYRLNAFGFFSTNTKNSPIPSNLGMWDQVAALRWVQKEIVNFGGNPGRVTIYGESAGAASVSLLTYSPAAAGLFRYVIMSSGTAWASWAVTNDATSSKAVAVQLNCITPEQWLRQEFDGMLDCMQSKDWRQILQAAGSIQSAGATLTPWAPVVDYSNDSFLPDTIANLFKTRRPPSKIILGTNHDEMNFLGGDFWRQANTSVPPYYWRGNFTDALHSIVNPQTFGPAAGTIAGVLDLHYANQMWVAENDKFFWTNATTKLLSDMVMHYPTVKEALMSLSQNVTVFLYSFDYMSKGSPWYPYIQMVPHAIELLYVFDMIPPGILQGTDVNWTKSADDQRIVDLMGSMWTNFAKVGTPNLPIRVDPQWASTSTQRPVQYCSIGINSTQQLSYHWDAFKLWDELVPQILAVSSVGSTTTLGSGTSHASSASLCSPSTDSSRTRDWEPLYIVGMTLLCVAIVLAGGLIVVAYLGYKKRHVGDMDMDAFKYHTYETTNEQRKLD